MGCAPSRNIVRPQAFDVVTVPYAAASGAAPFGLGGAKKKKSNALHPEPPAPVPANAAVAGVAAPAGGSIGSMGPSMELLPTGKQRLDRLSYEELGVQFLKAVKAGDVAGMECVELHVARTKHPSLIDVRGMWESTPLIYACQYAHPEAAKWLLERKADINLQNEKGVTPLLLASLEGMTDAVACILRIMSRISSRPTTLSLSQAETVLVVEDPGAVATPSISVDKQVGVVYNSQTDLNVRVNPLIAASMNGHAEIVALLISEGQASVNIGVGLNTTISAPKQFALLSAAKYGHADVIRQLMEHGADPNNCDGNGNHALLLCCEANKEDCALQLLRIIKDHDSLETEEDADIASIWKAPNCHGFTALHFAASHGLLSVCEFMLRGLQWQKDKVFVNHVTSTRSECAILMASRKKHWDVVELLIACGGDAQLADRGGTCALQVLRRENKDDLVRLCVRPSVISIPEPYGQETPVPVLVAETINEPREHQLRLNDMDMKAQEVPEAAVDNHDGVETTEHAAMTESTVMSVPKIDETFPVSTSVSVPEVPTSVSVPNPSVHQVPATTPPKYDSFDEENDSIMVPVVSAPTGDPPPVLGFQSDRRMTTRWQTQSTLADVHEQPPKADEEDKRATDRLMSFAPRARMVDGPEEEIIKPLVPSLSTEQEFAPIVIPLAPAMEHKSAAAVESLSAIDPVVENDPSSRFASRRMGPALTTLPARAEEPKLSALSTVEDSTASVPMDPTEEPPSSPSEKKPHHSRRSSGDPEASPSSSPTRRNKKKHHKKKAKAEVDSPVKDSGPLAETVT